MNFAALHLQHTSRLAIQLQHREVAAAVGQKETDTKTSVLLKSS